MAWELAIHMKPLERSTDLMGEAPAGGRRDAGGRGGSEVVCTWLGGGLPSLGCGVPGQVKAERRAARVWDAAVPLGEHVAHKVAA